jgi:RNA-directed DNA polymerase
MESLFGTLKRSGSIMSLSHLRRGQSHRDDFGGGKSRLARYAGAPIKRRVKVRGDTSPYDGDWLYWVQRLARDPANRARVVNLLKRQRSRCGLCGLCFGAEDVTEVHHWDGNRQAVRGTVNDRYAGLVLLHGHCHDEIHGNKCQ